MKWSEVLEGVVEGLGRGVAYRRGFNDALEGRGRTLRYLPGGSSLKTDEERDLYAQGYQDGLAERLLRRQQDE